MKRDVQILMVKRIKLLKVSRHDHYQKNAYKPHFSLDWERKSAHLFYFTFKN